MFFAPAEINKEAEPAPLQALNVSTLSPDSVQIISSKFSDQAGPVKTKNLNNCSDFKKNRTKT